MKKSVFVLVCLLLLSIPAIYGQFGVSGLDADGITWDVSPSEVYEFESKLVTIKFVTLNSDLIQTNVTTHGVIINEIANPSGCTINGNNITCTRDFDNLIVNITGIEVNDTTNFSWYINALDNESGLVNKTLYLRVLNETSIPQITLISPANNSIGNNTFTFNVTDDVSSEINCSLLIDSLIVSNAAVTNASTFSFITNLSDNSYSWSVSCSDQANNTNTSEIRTVLIDTTSPAITLISPLNQNGYNVNNTNTQGISNFTYSIVENNTVDTCTLRINGTEKSTTTNTSIFADINISLPLQNDAYSWSVSCNDTANNRGNSTTSYLYFDTLNPAISNLTNTSIDDDSAVISWNVDETANNTLYYGTNKTILQTNLSSNSNTNAGTTTTPSATISSLSAETSYYYVVVSCDQFDQCSNTSAQINSSTFTTSAAPSNQLSPSGGSGSSSSYTLQTCQESWICTPWEPMPCDESEEQTRTCTDRNLCGTVVDKPDKVKTCTHKTTGGLSPTEDLVEIIEGESSEEPKGLESITGRSIEDLQSPFTSLFLRIIAALLVLGAGFLGYKQIKKGWNKRKPRKKVHKVFNK